MFSYPEIKSFLGLSLQRNSFNLPDGYLEEADNVIISNDNVISKKRGKYIYYSAASSLNNLFRYDEHLLSVYANAAAYYTDTGSSPNFVGTQTALSGQTVTLTSPRVSRSFEAGNNFYFTTDNGVLKLTSFDSAIYQSGAPQGLDINADYVVGSSSTFLAADSILGYRVVFGYEDVNGNLVLGAPSDIVTVSNTETTDVGGARSGVGPYTITVTSTAHGRQTGEYLNFTLATGSTFTSAATGVYQITVVSANTFTYSVVADPGASGNLDYSSAMPVRLEYSIPSEISTALPWFVQIYRSSQQEISVGILSDFKLLDQVELTSAQISARVGFFTDDYDDVLLGAQLYTNENSGEGELQANYKPPKPVDVTYYKNYALYANCQTRQLLELAVIDPSVLASADYIELKISATTRRYVARTGVSNQTVTGLCSSSAGLLITYDAHNLLDGYTVYVANVVGGTLTAGTYYVVSAAANNFKISLTSGGAAIAYNGETSLTFEGVTDGTNPIFYLSTDTSAAVRLRDTAQGIVKAVNRDPSSLIYAQYVSLFDDIPGKMRFQSKGFVDPIYARANTTTAGGAFSPVLPASFSVGTQVYSTNDEQPNFLYISKFGEAEAVPLVNFLLVGSKNYAIARVHALRDSVIILKEDGVWRMTGDNISNFNVTLLDGTVIIAAPSSSVVINNQVMFLSNQGVCLVTESSVQIVSRTIEDVIQPILRETQLSAQTAGIAYESARLYIMTTIGPNDDTATRVYVYNFLTNGWTTWNQSLFKQGIIGPEDRLYTISLDDDIMRERKDQTKIDFCDQNYTVTISAVSSDTTSCNIDMGVAAYVPQNGDVIVKAEVINRIISDPVSVGGSVYTVTFSRRTNLVNADSVILYERIRSYVKFSPFHAGLVGRMKFFSEMQIHIRDMAISRAYLTFSGDTLGSSEETEWSSLLSASGWGEGPWGYFPWGDTESIIITPGTRPAPIVRTYVPLLQTRNTFIQTVVEHIEAAEALNIQSLSFAVRPYGGRVSR